MDPCGWNKINRHSHDFIRSSRSNGKEFSAFMGGLDEKVVSDDFNGCSVTAVMGGLNWTSQKSRSPRISQLNVPQSWVQSN